MQPLPRPNVKFSFTAFLRERDLEAPDKRPLYRYRTRDEEFESFRIFLRSNYDSPWWNVVFCLYAAEYLRRYYEGGHWSWEPILGSIGCESNTAWLYPRIERGLRYFKRELHKSDEQTKYLLTLVCEGGLPLGVLRNQGTVLRRFLSELIARAERYPHESVEAHTDVLAAKHLPRPLRKEAFLASVRQLVESLMELRKQVSTDDPVGELNRKIPDWREHVPIALSDDLARTLLEELVKAPREREDRSTELFVDTELHIVDDGGVPTASLVRVLRPIRKLTESSVQRLLGLDTEKALPSRLQLYLGDITEGDNLLVGTLIRCTDAAYSLQAYDAALPVRYLDSVTPITITNLAGNVLASYSVAGASSIDAAALVFSRPDATGDPRLVSTGSYRTKDESVLIVAAPDFSPIVEGTLTEYAVLPGIDKIAFILEGSASWHSEGRAIQIHTGDLYQESTYHLLGQLSTSLFIDRSVYLGMPSVIVRHFTPDTPDSIIASHLLDIKHKHSREYHRAHASIPYGHVRLRYTEEGRTLFTSNCTIVPPDLNISLYPSNDDNHGRIRISSQHVESITLGEDSHYRIVSQQCTTAQKEITIALIGYEARHLRLNIRFTNGGELEGVIPCPVTITSFVDRHARPIPRGAELSVNSLSGIVARHLAPQAHARRTIEVAVHLEETQRLRSKREIVGTLSPAGGYGTELHLHAIRDRLQLLLDSLPHPQATLGLSLVQAGEFSASHPQIFIRRHDAALHAKRNVGRGYYFHVQKLENALVDFNDVELRALPSWSPEAAPEILQRADDGDWYFPFEGHSQGTWVITAWSGDVCIAQPHRVHVWPAAPSAASGSSSLEETARFLPENERDFDPIFDAMAIDWFHPDWDHLLSYVETLSSFPPRTFDVLTALSRHPDALVLTLLKTRKSTMPSFLRGMQSLNVMWQLMPIKSWTRALSTMRDASVLQADEYAKMGLNSTRYSAENIYHERVSCLWNQILSLDDNTFAFIRVARDVQFYLDGDSPESAGFFRLFLDIDKYEEAARSIFQDLVRPALPAIAQDDKPISRHEISEDQIEPLATSFLERMFGEFDVNSRELLLAPIVAASYRTHTREASPSNDFVSYMRHLRAAAPEYYDHSHELALAYFLAKSHMKNDSSPVNS